MQILRQTLVSVFFNFTELIKAYGWKGNIKKLASLIWINSKKAPKGDLKITYTNMKWRGFLNTLSPLTSHLPCFSQVCGLGPSACEKKESPFSWMSLLLSLFCFSLVKLIGSATSKQTTIRCSMFDSIQTDRNDWVRTGNDCEEEIARSRGGVEGQEVGGHETKNSPQLLPWNRSETGRCVMLVEFKQRSMFGLFGRAFRLEIRECQDHFPRALREKGKK